MCFGRQRSHSSKVRRAVGLLLGRAVTSRTLTEVISAASLSPVQYSSACWYSCRCPLTQACPPTPPNSIKAALTRVLTWLGLNSCLLRLGLLTPGGCTSEHVLWPAWSNTSEDMRGVVTLPVNLCGGSYRTIPESFYTGSAVGGVYAYRKQCTKGGFMDQITTTPRPDHLCDTLKWVNHITQIFI